MTKITATIAVVLTALPLQQDPAYSQMRDTRPRAGVAIDHIELSADQAATWLPGPRPRPAFYGPVPEVSITLQQIELERGRLAAGLPGQILIVDCNGSFDHTTIQGAIDAAGDGDSVVVLPNNCDADNRYYENIDFQGKAIILRSIFPENPQVVAATVIDGGMQDLSVVRIIAVNNGEVTLDGLTITGGSGTPGTEFFDGIHVGGGVLCVDSQIVMRNCRVTANSATRGGGISAYGSVLTVESCGIDNNHVASEPSQGGYLWFGNGAGLHVEESALVMEHTRILNNVSVFDLGGFFRIFAVSGPGLLLETNQSDIHTSIRNCEFRGNNVTVNTSPGAYIPVGGAIEAHGGSSTTLFLSMQNTIVVDNQSVMGSALTLTGTGLTTTIQGCTIARNISAITETHPFSQSTASVSNSIAYANVPPGIEPDSSGPFLGAALTISYSNIETDDESVPEGSGNINSNPLFINPGVGNYHLLPSSPSIDSGDPAFVPLAGETDIDGNPRVLGGIVDMGADEFDADCNDNGIPDDQDILSETSSDCNMNGIPDECADLDWDCNANGIPDECELFGDGNNDGEVNLYDLLCMLDVIAGAPDCLGAAASEFDIFPCAGGDGELDLDDLSALIETLNGQAGCRCP